MSKVWGIFRGTNVRDIGNQAVLIDYGQIFKCFTVMMKNNAVLQNLYHSLRKNMMYHKEKLQYSEDLIEMIAEKFEGMDEMLERISHILRKEEELLRQKKEMLRKLREEIADSKFRLLSMKKPELEKYTKLARDRTAPGIAGLVREERAELERRLMSARATVNEYVERNLDDQEACTILQLCRGQLREDHDDNMLTILNEFGDLKKKRSFLLRNPVFNDSEGKKDLMQLFRVPREEMEATREEHALLRQRNEALVERIREQRVTKSGLTEMNRGILDTLLQEEDEACTAVTIRAPPDTPPTQAVGPNTISV